MKFGIVRLRLTHSTRRKAATSLFFQDRHLHASVWATGSVQVLHPHDAKRAHRTIMLRYRHILARYKAMPIKSETGLIVFSSLRIVVECPRATSAMHETAHFVFSAWPEPLDAASLARRAPLVSQAGGQPHPVGPQIHIPARCCHSGNSWSRANSSLMRFIVMTVVSLL